MNSHFNAHRPSRFAAHHARERRYPLLTALDTLIHWILCGCVTILAVVTVGLLLSLLLPDWAARVVFFARQLF